jgi:nucleotide-binding universal stress UspA family protein
VDLIFHPSDFSETSNVAFAHALKIALVTKAELTMLHATADRTARWQDFPGVRDTLERWGLIPKGCGKSAVAKLGIDISKVTASSRDPLKACLSFLRNHPADLIVLAVRQDSGRMHWLEKSVGKPLARAAGQITLFIPKGVTGFVSTQDGSISLRNILIPVAREPEPQPSVQAVDRIIRNFQLSSGTVTLLHVGTPDEMNSMRLPQHSKWTWNRMTRSGKVPEVILRTASELQADLIVMTTTGRDGFLDGLRGSTAERVLRKARCAVANLPVGSRLG